MISGTHNDPQRIYICWLPSPTLEKCLGTTPIFVAYEAFDTFAVGEIGYIIEVGKLHFVKYHLSFIVVVINHDVVCLDICALLVLDRMFA